MSKKATAQLIAILIAVPTLILLVTQSSPAPKVDKSIVYRIGYGNDVPFHFKEDDGEPSGLAYDLVSQAANRTGIQLEWIESEKFRKDEMDLWVLMTIKPDRQAHTHFTEPYLQTRTCFLVPEESQFRELADFASARISHANYGVHRENLAEYLPDCRPTPLESSREAVESMLAGQSDAAYLDQYAALRAMLEGQLSTSVRVIDSRIPPLEMAIAASFETSHIADALREGMKKLVQEGSIGNVLGRWDLFPNLTDNLVETLVSAEKQIRILTLTLLITAFGFILTVWLLLKLRKQTRRLKATQESLKESAEQYRAIIENTYDIVYSIDTNGQIAFLGPQAINYGIDPESAVSQNIMEFIFDEDKARVSKELKETLSSGEEHPIEFRVVNKEGRPIWFEESGKLLREADGTIIGITGALREITERKQAEAEQLRLEQELRHSQKMEAIGLLAGGIAHDFNNILATMSMNLDLLRDEPRLSENVQTGLTDLSRACGRAADLTKHLLTFSRRSVLEIKPVNLAEATRETLRMIRRLLGEDIKIMLTEEDTPLPPIEADAGVLEQILMNLCVNARDAMPNGGQLTISTSVRRIEADAQLTNPDSRPGEFVCLTIADTGKGMDQETQKQIFDPFFTTKDVGKGTGLGLSSVQGSVAQHGGWINVTSVPERGSRFEIYFPSSQNAIKTTEERQIVLNESQSETILVVEDEPSVRSVVKRALTKLGYHVIEASDGQEASDQWQEHHERIDLLFTDVVLPGGMNGFELVEKLRESQPNLKVVVSSGYNTESSKLREKGTQDLIYLPKPYSITDLGKVVRQSLDQPSGGTADL